MKKLYILALWVGLLFLFPLVTVAAPEPLDPAKIKSYKACVKCHEKQVKKWEKTKHFAGYKKLSKKKEAKEIAEKMGINPKKIKKSKICASCHYTTGLKRGKPKSISGVSCESCHGASEPWLKIHNDFGGKGVKKKFEAPEHKAEREEKMTEAGMIYPGDYYGFAKNCFNCHVVANEELVNKTKHAAGSKFDFVKRTQEKDVHHGPATSIESLRIMQVVGFAVEFEISIRALATASKGNRFDKKMKERSLKALANLQDISRVIQDANISELISTVSQVSISAGNSGLIELAEKISGLLKAFSASADGKRYANLDNRKVLSASNAKLSSVTSSVATSKISSGSVKTPANKVPAVIGLAKPAVQPANTSMNKTHEEIAKPSVKPLFNMTRPSAGQSAEAKQKPAVQSSNQPQSNLGPFITSFELVKPKSNHLCNTNNPWMLGEEIINDNNRLKSNDCLSIRIKSNRNATLHLFNLGSNGKLIQLLPNSCHALGAVSNSTKANQSLQLPVDRNGNPAVIGLDNEKGNEWFFIVATDSTSAEAALKSTTRMAGGVCEASNTSSIAVSDFQAALKKLQEKQNIHLQWLQKRVIHD